MIVVLDTSVFIRGLRGCDPAPSKIMSAWRQSKITLAYSLPMLEELRRVLTSPCVVEALGKQITQVEQALADLSKSAILTRGKENIPLIVDDPSGNMFLVCAKEARADLLVSEDHEHTLPLKQFENTAIVTPEECIEILKRPSL